MQEYKLTLTLLFPKPMVSSLRRCRLTPRAPTHVRIVQLVYEAKKEEFCVKLAAFGVNK